MHVVFRHDLCIVAECHVESVGTVKGAGVAVVQGNEHYLPEKRLHTT